MKNQKWFLAERGQRVGPLTFDELKNRNLTPETMVYCTLIGKWTKASQVMELGIEDIPPPPCEEVPPIPNVNAGGDIFKKYIGKSKEFWRTATPNQKYIVTGAGMLILFLICYFSFKGESPEEEFRRNAREAQGHINEGLKQFNQNMKQINDGAGNVFNQTADSISSSGKRNGR